jgi:sugar phosphate isomerase/epimerase
MDVDEYARLDAVAKYVINVHAQNFTRSSGDCQRTRIREGDVDYKRVYRMLQGAGFEGYMEVEFVCGDNFEEKVKALRKDYRYLRGL